MKGFDTNRILTPATIACLKQAGYQFAGRYLRGFTKQEAQLISDAGLQIVSIHEMGQPTSVNYFSYDRGQKDGVKALRQAQAINQPKGTAIFATVDYDAIQRHLSAIAAYFKGFNDSIKQLGGQYVVGGYGSGLVLNHLLEAGLLDYTWLCGSTGYQGYHSFTEWDIRQGKQVPACGIMIDTDESQGDDFGSWTLNQQQPAPTPQPNPQPQPTLAPQPAQTYTVVAGDSFYGIAAKFGNTFSPFALATKNGLQLTSVIHPGQVLQLPGRSIGA